MTFRNILDQNKNDIALVIGNGINRYGLSGGTVSWEEILIDISKSCSGLVHTGIPKGVALTEFYDLMDLQVGNETKLQGEFCIRLEKWEPRDHHIQIVNWAKAHHVPVMTTNFDYLLGKAGGCRLMRMRKEGFTDYYPWESYYGCKEITEPESEFGIWHINGMIRYQRSVRLGLTHYMGAVERARGWINKNLYAGNNEQSWPGAKTWLQAIFHKSLVIFGIGLERDEVFLRWLLIERARYFRKFPDRSKSAWYIYADGKCEDGMQYFLHGVKVETVSVKNIDKLYGEATWRISE